MGNIEKLLEFFNNGSADSERDFLVDVFVPSEDFDDIISFPSKTCRLLIGNKGSGKSALLEYIDLNCHKNDIFSIYLTPDEILEEDFDEQVSVAMITKKLQRSIVRAIAIKMGEGLHGLLNEQDYALFSTAVESGNIDDGVFNKLLKILAPIGTALTDINFKEMLQKNEYTSNYFIKAINDNLNRKEKLFYVLVDDVDQISSVANSNYYDVIWGTLLAIQKIATKLPNIRPIITLRTEVWRNVINDSNGNRDQIDHIRSMIRNINPAADDIRKILRKRILYCVEGKKDIKSAYQVFFEGERCKLPRTNQDRTWEDFLVTSSRERPRDTVQLVQHLANKAKKANKDKIGNDEVESTASTYSHERFSDIVAENKDICDQIETIIRSFVNVDFELQAKEVLEHLKKVPSYTSIKIQKRVLQPGNQKDALEIWHLLYNIEFLTPRVVDNTRASLCRYIRPSEDTTLVSWSRWNDMQRYVWDVHPCYRVFLMDEYDSKQKAILPADYNPKAKATKRRTRH